LARPENVGALGRWAGTGDELGSARVVRLSTAVTSGTLGARVLADGVVGEPYVNLELHALDAALSLLRHKGYACVR